MELIRRNTAPSVWLAAVEHLENQPSREDFDVILHVEQPTVLSSMDRLVVNELDAFLTSHAAFSLHTVAETIFPLDEYKHAGAKGVFGEFPEKLRRLQKSRKDGNWGIVCHIVFYAKKMPLVPCTIP